VLVTLKKNYSMQGTPIGMPVVFHKDDPKFASDLSFMTEEDWARYMENDARKKKERSKRNEG